MSRVGFDAELQAPMEGPDTTAQIKDSEYDDQNWLGLVTEAENTSTTHLDTNYRKQWERNISNWRNTHPSGSKYHSDSYRHRSTLFRPKIRTATRGAEASFAEAMFATREVMNVEPVNQSDKKTDIASEMWEAVLNYHLQNSIPWYLISVGSFQETNVYGIVASKQYWEDDDAIEVESIEGDAGLFGPVEPEASGKPVIELLAIENVRFDPGASWIDPVNTSPYFIEMIPMYICDVVSMSEDMGWEEYTKNEIYAAGREIDRTKETLRQAREDDNEDPKDSDISIKEYEIVWVYHNWFKKDGVDWEFYTLTNKKMLSKPEQVTPETHPIGRPYRIGISAIETHRPIPSSVVQLAQDLQAEANDNANQRIDNVRLVLNKGHYIKRSANVDMKTLKRSYPGRIVQTDDLDAIRADETKDVTGSSYAEQDRVDNDIDSLLGGSAGPSVAANRRLGETVGGMEMFQSSGNKVQGFSVRTLVETWIEPVLNDVVKLCMAYESDRVLEMFIPEPKAPPVQQQQPGMPPQQEMTPQMPIQQPDIAQIRMQIDVPMKVTVSVGLGPLEPKQKARGIVEALSVMAKIVPEEMADIDAKAIARDLFGVLGMRDGAKYFKKPDEEQQKQPPPDPMAEAKMAELAHKDKVLERDTQYKSAKLEQDYELKMAELALKWNITLQQAYNKLDIEAPRMELEGDKFNLNVMSEMTRREEIQAQREEMELAKKTGSGV